MLQFRFRKAGWRSNPLAEKGDSREILDARIIRYNGTVDDATNALKGKHFRNWIAIDLLAFKILVEGTVGQAAEMLKEGVASEKGKAQYHLSRRIVEAKDAEKASDALMSGKVTDHYSQVELARCIANENDTGLARMIYDRREELCLIPEAAEILRGFVLLPFHRN